jgi:SAM-dependent methyltransferase
MADYEHSTYGDRIAAVYDQFHSHSPVARFTDATVEFLASIAGKRRVLELGIGTGRIAVPLAAKGLKVFGIDASEKMVEKMREKPGGDAIPVVLGNFADVKIGGQFSLIYVVFSTFFALLSQEEQVRCLQRVARHLTAEGAFVMEAFVPDPSRFDRGQRVGALDVDTDRVRLEVTRHDPTTQSIRSAHIEVSESGSLLLYPVQLRYAGPVELDLMARLAGMRLRGRYGGWNGEPFNAASQVHVSVYELIAAKAEPAPKSLARKSASRRRPK